MGYHLQEISAEQFAELAFFFAEQANFAQSVQMGNVRQNLGWQVTYLALYRNERAVCIGMAALSKTKAPVLDFLCGPLADFSDLEICREWTKAVVAYAKRQRAVSLHCNPNIVYQQLDPFGLAQGKPNDVELNNLQQAGWLWQGLTTKTAQPRFLYKLDLQNNYDDTFASFDVSARTAIRRARENSLTLRQLHYSELAIFKAILEETAQRQGFVDRDMSYYQALFNAFGDDAYFMTIEFNCIEQRNVLKARIAELTREQTVAKGKGRKRQLGDQINGAENLLRKTRHFPDQGEAVPINTGLFIRHGDELIYLFGGTRSDYLSLNAVYLLQDLMIERCLEWGISRYNFYGISGVFRPDDPTYGVLAFKQAFGGYIDELIGDFSIVLDPLRYSASRLAGRLARQLRKAGA